jgi:hypothetical protein
VEEVQEKEGVSEEMMVVLCLEGVSRNSHVRWKGFWTWTVLYTKAGQPSITLSATTSSLFHLWGKKEIGNCH